MGQVPPNPTYLFIGNGRASRHFQHYFSGMGVSFEVWDRRESSSSLTDKAGRCDVILVLISDSAIEPFLTEHPVLSGKVAVHFSGSLVTPKAYGFHPLMTFSSNLYPISVYREMAFIREDSAPEGFEIFPRLANRFFAIPDAMKPLYHSLCVMSGNFSTILWRRCMDEFREKLQIPGDAVIPYMKRVFANLAEESSPLTGPLARKDRKTVDRNLAALDGHALRPVYEKFLDLQWPEYRRDLL